MSRADVIVVTMPELGWDCVVAVLEDDDLEEDEVLKKYPEGEYVIHHMTVEQFDPEE